MGRQLKDALSWKAAARCGLWVGAVALLCHSVGCATGGAQQDQPDDRPMLRMAQTATPEAFPHEEWPDDIPEEMDQQDYVKLARGAKAIIKVMERIATSTPPHLTRDAVENAIKEFRGINSRPNWTKINERFNAQHQADRDWVEKWWDESRQRAEDAEGWVSLRGSEGPSHVRTSSAIRPATDGLTTRESTALRSVIDDLENPPTTQSAP